MEDLFMRVRDDFPILSRTVSGGRPLVYLDSAATSQKPVSVLDAERAFYVEHNAAVHRGVHTLAEEATEEYEAAREAVAAFVGARADEIVFTKNATEAINLVAYSLGNAQFGESESRRFRLVPGDEVVVTEMEHHANLVPWQQLCLRTGATLRWVGVTPDGRLDMSGLPGLVGDRTRLVSVTHQSNVLGTINPVPEIAARAHAVGALVLVDAAQSVPHMPIQVDDLGADFVVFSGHKMLGPLGIGVLWGRRSLLEAMPPFLTGGSMIESVRIDQSTFAPPPQRFEAGVPMAAQAVGLRAAIDYLTDVGMQAVQKHETELVGHALEKLQELPGVQIVGPSTLENRGGAVSFTVDDVHPHDVSQVLDSFGVEVRAGHHCAWPLHHALGIQATTRASFYLYNTLDDVEALVAGIRHAQSMFR